MDLPHAPETVFRYLADPRNRPEWQSSLLSVTMVDRGEPRVGTTWRDNTVTGIVRPRMEITELVPFRSWAERGRFAGVEAELRLRFRGIPTGCRVLSTGSVTGAGRLGGLAARGAVRAAPWALRRDLQRAGDILTRRPR